MFSSPTSISLPTWQGQSSHISKVNHSSWHFTPNSWGYCFLKLYFHSFTNSNICMFLWPITNDTRKLRLLTVVNMTIPRKLKEKLCLFSLLTEIFSPTSKQVLHSNYSLSDKSPFLISRIWNRPKKLSFPVFQKWSFSEDVELFWISTFECMYKNTFCSLFFF